MDRIIRECDYGIQFYAFETGEFAVRFSTYFKQMTGVIISSTLALGFRLLVAVVIPDIPYVSQAAP